MRYIKTSKEYNNFQVDVSDNSVTAYRVEISFGIASVKECIHVVSNLNIKLSYEGSPIPLPKNIRNNLLAKKSIQVPSLDVTVMDDVINIPPGTIRWSTFHRVHEKDLAIECHVKKAPKISYQVLHPGNNKQSVPLALAISDLSTISAISQYFPEEKTTYTFLNLIYTWWLVVNSKERFHPIIVGNAQVLGDGKIEFLRIMDDW